MKIKASVRYYIKDMLGSVKIFYLIIALIDIIAIILNYTTNFYEHSRINGLEIVTIIFLFVYGLNTFKSQFKFLSQNSVSRKTVVISFMVSSIFVCIMAFIDVILCSIMSLSIDKYTSLFNLIFGTIYTGYSFTYFVVNFVYFATFYMAVIMFGHFISSLYFKMNTPLKVIVSVGMFLVFNFFWIVMNLKPVGKVVDIIITMWGYNSSCMNPWMSSLMNMFVFLIFGGLSYLCIKNVKVRE